MTRIYVFEIEVAEVKSPAVRTKLLVAAPNASVAAELAVADGRGIEVIGVMRAGPLILPEQVEQAFQRWTESRSVVFTRDS